MYPWLWKLIVGVQSYVLHQERNILSSTAVTAPATSTGGGAALSRAGTRKRPAQPLLNLGQSTIPDPLAPPPPPTFEPGSLLAKRGVWTFLVFSPSWVSLFVPSSLDLSTFVYLAQYPHSFPYLSHHLTAAHSFSCHFAFTHTYYHFLVTLYLYHWCKL